MIGLLIGMMLGANIGVLVMCLCIAAREDKRENE